MQTILKTGLEQYRRRKKAEQEYYDHCGRIKELLELNDRDRLPLALLCLTPLIDIAWTDGRVGRSEQDAILAASEIYGLLDDEERYAQLMERLTSRPRPDRVKAYWKELADNCRDLQPDVCAAFASHLYQQTKYVGELSEKYVFGLWRAYRMGDEESQQLLEAEKRISGLTTIRAREEMASLVPLVKVAWADGRVTRRERQMIFDSMVEMHIPESEENLLVLADWLELRPDDEFFREALNDLRNELSAKNEDDVAKQKYDILSRCTLVAEVSGGSIGFVGGGERICREEVESVKEIARILNAAMSQRPDDRSRREK
jgi:hypothetical protein